MLRTFRFIRFLRLDQILISVLAQGPTYSLANYSKGLENAEAVSRIFGARTEEILRNLKVQFAWIGGCGWVNGATGHLITSSRYLKEGDKTEIHLDLTHELVPVNSWAKEELFDVGFSYVDRPMDVEPYGHAVEAPEELG